MKFLPGTMMGRYRVEGILGQGQAGIVYRGFDTLIERIVAIKCLLLASSPGQKDADHAELLELFREARLIGQITHAHVASVYDMGWCNGTPYLVMEYVEGETLKARMAQRAHFSQELALNFMAMLARALHHVHQRGILHGDIKPSNIVVTSRETPKIMDFGVARRTRSDTGTLSLAGESTVWGTPHYLAPERLIDDEIDARADVFSLGVIAYEWFGQQRPFAGARTEDVLKAVLAGKPTPLTEIGPVDADLARVIHKAMAHNPAQRFASADAFADALEVYRGRWRRGSLAVSRGESVDPESGQRFLRLAKRNLYFADFSEDELLSILQLSHEERYQTGACIVQEGTGGSAMYLVLEGLVSVRKSTAGRLVELRQISAGNGFGEMAVVSQMPRSATVVALEPTDVVVISGAVLRTSNPALATKLYRNIATMLAERLRDTNQRMLPLLSSHGAPPHRHDSAPQ